MSAGRVTVTQAWEPELHPRLIIKAGCGHVFIIRALEGRDSGNPWESLASQPSLLGTFQVLVKDPVSKALVESSWRKASKVSLWPPQACTHASEHTWRQTPTYKLTNSNTNVIYKVRSMSTPTNYWKNPQHGLLTGKPLFAACWACWCLCHILCNAFLGDGQAGFRKAPALLEVDSKYLWSLWSMSL